MRLYDIFKSAQSPTVIAIAAKGAQVWKQR